MRKVLTGKHCPAMVIRVIYPQWVWKEGEQMADSIVYSVPAIHCAHCEAAIAREVGVVEGVERVEVDLDSKRVTVHGERLNDDRLRAAIDEAGFDVAA